MSTLIGRVISGSTAMNLDIVDIVEILERLQRNNELPDREEE
jgi:hypothetical protein